MILTLILAAHVHAHWPRVVPANPYCGFRFVTSANKAACRLIRGGVLRKRWPE